MLCVYWTTVILNITQLTRPHILLQHPSQVNQAQYTRSISIMPSTRRKASAPTAHAQKTLAFGAQNKVTVSTYPNFPSYSRKIFLKTMTSSQVTLTSTPYPETHRRASLHQTTLQIPHQHPPGQSLPTRLPSLHPRTRGPTAKARARSDRNRPRRSRSRIAGRGCQAEFTRRNRFEGAEGERCATKAVLEGEGGREEGG